MKELRHIYPNIKRSNDAKFRKMLANPNIFLAFKTCKAKLEQCLQKELWLKQILQKQKHPKAYGWKLHPLGALQKSNLLFSQIHFSGSVFLVGPQKNSSYGTALWMYIFIILSSGCCKLHAVMILSCHCHLKYLI